MRSPPNRHVIAMNSMEECRRAAEFSKAKCVYRQPSLPDASVEVMRSLQWSTAPVPGVSLGTPTALLKEGDFGLVYLVVGKSPPNRYVIAMDSMKKCLEAAANTSAKCRKELPKLPDASVPWPIKQVTYFPVPAGIPGRVI